MRRQDSTVPDHTTPIPIDPPTIPHGYDEYEPLPPASPPPRRRRRVRNLMLGCWRWFRTGMLVSLMGLGAILGTALIIGLVIYNSLAGELQEDMAALQSMEGVEDFQTTRIFDREGNLLYEIFDEGRRDEVTLDDIPLSMRWATVATEDDTFYENPGFDPQSIARAAYQWYTEGEIVSGGSTITQQLIRQIVFTYEERNEQTLRRKLKEAALAWLMTRQYSKDQVLEIYLNEIYYGNLAYGVEAAAGIYFDKHAKDLTIAEAAFLAGLVQSPAVYDPYTNFEGAKIRQRQVLDLMVRHGYIAQRDADFAFAEAPVLPSDLASPDISLEAPHFTVAVRNELADVPGIDPQMIARGGLRIYTTLAPDIQEMAGQIAAEQVAEISAEANLHNAAVVIINPNTGEVLAMVGSVDYYDESIDGNVNVILSPQQPGSAMKPLTYALAFEQGWTAADIIWDVDLAYPDGMGGLYEPVNYDGRYHGPVRLRDALANSYNVPAVELLEHVTVPGLLDYAKRVGIESLGDDASLYGLALTLGGGELTPLELTTAYAVFANGGYKIDPHLITHIEDSDGNLIYEAHKGVGERVLDERIAFLISSILSDNAARTPAMGSDSPLLLEFPAAAKTGTTNDFRDNWTVGYTRHVVIGVWAGNTDNSAMAEGTSGLTGAAPIWNAVMTGLYNDPAMISLFEGPGLPPLRSEFEPPERMEQRQVCILSSLTDPAPVDQGCTRLRAEWFLTANEQDLLMTPTAQPTATWTPRPTVEGEPPRDPLPYVRIEIEKDIWAIAVLPVTEERLAKLTPTLDQMIATRPPDTPIPVTPRYCEVPQESADAEGSALQLFIAAPKDPADAIRARNWAIANSRPIEPGLPCIADVLVMATPTPPVFDPIAGQVTYSISYPQPGQGVYGVFPVIGTALFDPLMVQYYKLEISGGSLQGWVTFGETHTQSVFEGILEMLHADALPPGDYVIRLVLVSGGNYVQPTYDVPIRILSEPPTATPIATP